MQFDYLRAFPYPVLRPKVDDYIDGDIQATIDFKQSAESMEVTAEITFAVSVPEIANLILNGDAQYAAVFACRDTYFRKAAMSQSTIFTQTFASGTLRGEVIIYPYVVAKKAIKNFACDWINKEFGDGPFDFEEGTVLALDEPQSIYVDRESFKPISSSFVLVKNDALTDNEWRVEAGQDKIHIVMSPKLKEHIDAARNSNENKAILLNSVYFSSVVQCVSYLKNGSEYNDFRWAHIFKQRCTDLSIDITKHDEISIAQQLMKNPISLLDAYFFGEKPE